MKISNTFPCRTVEHQWCIGYWNQKIQKTEILYCKKEI